MDSATLAIFCNVREVSFIEMGVRNGTKGAWFSDRKYNRRFVTAEELSLAIATMRVGQPQLQLKMPA
ncbi:MAG: hypothetical protein IT462_07985 [Planctomycetes bacterium]|nr:hypothetical protein [Planctomycetota bacterium]